MKTTFVFFNKCIHDTTDQILISFYCSYKENIEISP